jgi:hypothetical protein
MSSAPLLARSSRSINALAWRGSTAVRAAQSSGRGLTQEGIHRIAYLRDGNIAHRLGMTVEAGVAHVGDDADDDAGTVLELAPHERTDRDPLLERPAALPVLAGEGGVADRDLRHLERVVFRERAPSEQPDFEHVEVAVRRALQPRHPIVGAAHERPAVDDERD